MSARWHTCWFCSGPTESLVDRFFDAHRLGLAFDPCELVGSEARDHGFPRLDGGLGEPRQNRPRYAPAFSEPPLASRELSCGSDRLSLAGRDRCQGKQGRGAFEARLLWWLPHYFEKLPEALTGAYEVALVETDNSAKPELPDYVGCPAERAQASEGVFEDGQCV
jgi:hypothetical protein